MAGKGGRKRDIHLPFCTDARLARKLPSLGNIFEPVARLEIFSATGATIDEAPLYGGWYSTGRYL